jgi:hypothetical protein
MQRRLATLVLAAAVGLGACRNDDGSGGVSTSVTLIPSTAGAHGCSGPDQVFAPPQVPSALALFVLSISPVSHVTADGTSETLFATGTGGQVVEIDVTGAPVETELVAPGVIATLLGTAGIATAPVVSGIAVFDVDTLLVVEQTSNTIVAVDRNTADTVSFFAGEPNEAGGFASGFASGPLTPKARFNFDRPTQICPTADPFGGGGSVYVADPGNHAVREIAGGFVGTIGGTGAAFFLDGELPMVGFDTPTGLTVRCSGTLLITEEGGAAFLAGNRLRQAMLAQASFFTGSGMLETLAGDGVEATLGGDGVAAQLARPVSPLSTSADDVYWIDAATGILRRMTGPADTVDCPLWADCNAAVVGGGNFTPGGVLSLTQTPGGVLYVLDAAAATIFRVTP